MIDALKRLPASVLLGMIRLYQITLSPWIGQQCRFYPSCSHYAAHAVTQYGAVQGSWLALRRLLKCHPFHAGGFDPVPEPCVRKAILATSDDSSQDRSRESQASRHCPSGT
ncbi:MAG: membrane protein insertion efficiency factor YidD [Proteobacteria bacterium]|nr:membrane protein insertion efficiency factor YidD [Pseudomonadota bacterium]